MIKLCCKIHNQTNICLPNLPSLNFVPSSRMSVTCLEKTRGEMKGGSSIVFSEKAVAKEHFFEIQTNLVN